MNLVDKYVGTWRDIIKCILKLLEDDDVDINELQTIVCDGKATKQDGKMVLSASKSLKIQHPLQRFRCLLPLNEVPFKPLFEYLDDDRRHFHEK
ncbi:hypothetical protein AVEN_227956-1 [Araneus ventricosus]|uniref:Uncharacterized protein n=1 Tax=Araneus ventricosus TaxID=182803 RepID=A0A4Y2NKK7_ARAVE|nr:hypothetical protein AVEN_227956-1 [Araneus ventricosus]